MKLKAWFVYEGSDSWLNCTMVFENGWAPFGHLCSHPNFAPGDLWFGRPERIRALKSMDIEPDIQGLVSVDNLPTAVLEKYKDEANWKHLDEQYEIITKRSIVQEQPKVVIEFSEEKS